MTGVIYKICSKIKPNRFYVGSTKNQKTRIRQHFVNLRNNEHHSHKLQHHYNKYGESDLYVEIIENCEEGDLLIREQYYLDTLNPWFNECKKANSKEGYIVSDETRKKQSDAKLGHVPWNKGKTGYHIDKKNTAVSEESRRKISESLKLFYLQHPEAKEHLREINKGKPLCNEAIDKRNKTRKKAVLQFSINGDFIKEWETVSELRLTLGLKYNQLMDMLQGKRESINGFVFKYRKI